MELKKVYITCSEVTDPYYNLALEQVLLEALEPGEVTLYLWQNADTIVIGRNQNAWRECRVEAFRAEGGRLARRLSGGGAVYHDMGNQNFTFLAQDGLYDVEKQTEVIRLAAARFGIRTERSGRNDILAEGRKFSGNAFYRAGENRYHHGTILIGSDMGRLARFLVPSEEKLAEKGVASVRSRVVNLKELAPGLTPAAMRKALGETLGEVYGVEVVPLPAGRVDAGRMEALRAHYASEAWRLGRQRALGLRLFGRLGFGEVELQLTAKDGTVAEAAVYTDALEGSWAEPLRNALIGVEGTAGAVAGVVREADGLSADAAEELAAMVMEKWPE